MPTVMQLLVSLGAAWWCAALMPHRRFGGSVWSLFFSGYEVTMFGEEMERCSEPD